MMLIKYTSILALCASENHKCNFVTDLFLTLKEIQALLIKFILQM